MNEVRFTYPRVLAIDPTSRGFAYTVFEGPNSLLDWGLTEIEGRRLGRNLRRIEKLIERYAPAVLVLEDLRGQAARRRRRAHRVIQAASMLARRSAASTARFSRRTMRRVLAGTQAATKQTLALAIAERFPELTPRLPRLRKPWMSEDERMSIFDAASLALTYYANQRQHASNAT